MAENEKEEPERTYVLCLSEQMARWTPNSVVEGAVIKQCETCGINVWLAPSGQRMQETQPVSLICFSCMTKIKEDNKEELKFGGVVPGAFKEFEDHLNKEE